MANTTDIIISGLGLKYDDEFRLLLNKTLGVNFLPIPMKEGDSTGKTNGFDVLSYCERSLDRKTIAAILQIFNEYKFEMASYVILTIDCDTHDDFNGIHIRGGTNGPNYPEVYMNGSAMTI